MSCVWEMGWPGWGEASGGDVGDGRAERVSGGREARASTMAGVIVRSTMAGGWEVGEREGREGRGDG